jgi:DNA invertase Pin-like site-specific DNA recombinase
LAQQEQSIRAFLRQQGVRQFRFFEDRGVPGAVEDRPGLAELLAELRPGDVVVVARLDRLARDLLTQEFLLREIRQRGADLVSCSDTEADYLQDDPHDPTRKLVRQVLGAISEFERALIKLRLQRGRA